MSYILVDTCVFLRLPTAYEETLDCIMKVSDVIALTKQILKEYEGRASASRLVLQAFLEDLNQKDKIQYFRASVVTAAHRRRRRARATNYPLHRKDRMWIDTAIAVGATYIVSTNDHLLRLRANRSDGGTVEAIDPFEYKEIRCPNKAD